MIKFLFRLLWGCDHEFELQHDVSVRCEGDGRYHCKTYFCKKCGKVKRVKSH